VSDEETLPWPQGIGFEFLLSVAEVVEGDPQCDDLGAVIAAAARASAMRMGRPIYATPFLRAAAAAITLIRERPLEAGNLAYGLVAATGYLRANGIHLVWSPDEGWDLAKGIETYTLGVTEAAAVLKSWEDRPRGEDA